MRQETECLRSESEIGFVTFVYSDGEASENIDNDFIVFAFAFGWGMISSSKRPSRSDNEFWLELRARVDQSVGLEMNEKVILHRIFGTEKFRSYYTFST